MRPVMKNRLHSIAQRIGCLIRLVELRIDLTVQGSTGVADPRSLHLDDVFRPINNLIKYRGRRPTTIDGRADGERGHSRILFIHDCPNPI